MRKFLPLMAVFRMDANVIFLRLPTESQVLIRCHGKGLHMNFSTIKQLMVRLAKCPVVICLWLGMVGQGMAGESRAIHGQ
ncbi:hypothetical protein VI06_11030 [Aquitalea magnusonii]|nr:hypothetical protein VI06_11030 [Aquitalea magnusonii]